MTCRAPLGGVRTPDGKLLVSSKVTRPKNLAQGYEALDIPCGQCMSCRLEKQRVWSVRMMNEAAFWEEALGKSSIFVTLTYDDQHIHPHHTLVKDDIQRFFKRLWWKVESDKLRYYVVGEYGSQCPDHELYDCPQCGPLQRPHYHALIFGWHPPPNDKERLCTSHGVPIYKSKIIDDAWGMGQHEYGTCTFESCSYVSGYITKKQTGPDAPDYYTRHIWQTDQIVDIEPEFAMMSKNPGIGKYYFDAYHENMYQRDQLSVPGRGDVGKPPPYYDAHFEKLHPNKMEEIKADRRKRMAESLVDGPPLASRAICQDAKRALRKPRSF